MIVQDAYTILDLLAADMFDACSEVKILVFIAENVTNSAKLTYIQWLLLLRFTYFWASVIFGFKLTIMLFLCI